MSKRLATTSRDGKLCFTEMHVCFKCVIFIHMHKMSTISTTIINKEIFEIIKLGIEI